MNFLQKRRAQKNSFSEKILRETLVSRGEATGATVFCCKQWIEEDLKGENNTLIVLQWSFKVWQTQWVIFN